MSECRFCNNSLEHIFVDLGITPSANSYLEQKQLEDKELLYPLVAYVCKNCLLVQLLEIKKPAELFTNYAYFSSYSDSWLEHAKNYVKMMINRFHLNENQHVIEIASNDGYLLQYFKEKNIFVTGIEPAKNVSKIAKEKGINTIEEFFDEKLAKKLVDQKIQGDVILGNNVLAHVPKINEFVKGLKIILKPSGVITMEFPHLLQLMMHNQFDTIYHEHFSYFSFHIVKKIFEAQKLSIFDVEEIKTHGGSLRIFIKHSENDEIDIKNTVETLIKKEQENGLLEIETYLEFKNKVKKIKKDLNQFLENVKIENKKVICYGAPAKGNTLLNFCNIDSTLIEFVVDKNPHKQGLFLPGTHIPIKSPDKIHDVKPDYLLILPWNIKEEVMKQTEFIRSWGGKYVIPIPKVMII